jgi:acyl-CoA thioester hydrolase
MKAIVSAVIDLDIQFYHLDPMVVCWHGNYVRFFEQARCVLLRNIDYDYPQMDASGYYWPVIDLQIRYIKPVFYQQQVEIIADLVEYEHYLKIDYLVRNKEGGEKLTKGMTKQVAVKKSNMEMQLVSPQILLDKLSPYL